VGLLESANTAPKASSPPLGDASTTHCEHIHRPRGTHPPPTGNASTAHGERIHRPRGTHPPPTGNASTTHGELAHHPCSVRSAPLQGQSCTPARCVLHPCRMRPAPLQDASSTLAGCVQRPCRMRSAPVQSGPSTPGLPTDILMIFRHIRGNKGELVPVVPVTGAAGLRVDAAGLPADKTGAKRNSSRLRCGVQVKHPAGTGSVGEVWGMCQAVAVPAVRAGANVFKDWASRCTSAFTSRIKPTRPSPRIAAPASRWFL